jgi:stage II sporulation protein D
MRRRFRSKLIVFLVAPALLVSSVVFAQEEEDAGSPQTRPRRAQGTSTQTQTTTSAPPGTTRLTAEPIIRIGLTTDARSVSISTTGRQLHATEQNAAAPTQLAATRVRIEARNLSPASLPQEAATFRVEMTGAATRVDADRAARAIREQTGQSPEIALDAATNTWRIRVGARLSRAEAESLRARLRDAGHASASIVNEAGAQVSDAARASSSGAGGNLASAPAARLSGASGVRPVSRMSAPLRELVVYASGATQTLSSRAPLTFSADNESSAPVRFNDKPYRGRLEVFANAGGGLTVVNVLGLEDYVRGVVPNELSPGGYPAIEAQKAQAIAARTYAVRNRDNFAEQGFDLLPTTRSQVYGGLSTEHPLSSRAVDETRGLIATYKGEPINALYTSTCGGRTENAENIFGGEAVPYLRGRECSLEGRAQLAPFTLKTSREPADIREEQNAQLARDAALLAIHGFSLSSARITDGWLAAAAPAADVRAWLSVVARLAHQTAPPVSSDDAARPPAFSTALSSAVYGQGRADTLLDDADVDYLLAFRDAGEVPAPNRADVALLLRDGFLSLYPDATLRPREAMSRGRILHPIVRILEARGLLSLQKGTTRPSAGGALVLRSGRNRDQSIAVSADAYLFRAFGEGVYQMRSLALMGGEPVTFHVNTRGQVDYMEVRPAQDGAAAERFSPFTNWTSELSLGAAQARLARWSRGIGSLTDLRIAARGSSRRVTDLEMVGTSGTAHLRGGRIRSALGLREQLFVIDRQYDPAGRVTGFLFTGRGWGHGVGMCQVGAYGLARAGLTYDKILKSYYSGIELTKLY